MSIERGLRQELADLQRSHARLLDQVNDLEQELDRLREQDAQTIAKLEKQVWDLSKELQTAQCQLRKEKAGKS